MKVVIIEDELPSARRLERLLTNFEIEIAAVLSSVKESEQWFSVNEHPDILFLDVHLSDGLCFEIFNRVEITSKIIFTTAFSNYSIKAFDYNSISYLLKPINEENLAKAIQKATKITKKENNLLRLREMILNYETEIYKTSFTIKFGKKIKIINENEVQCFYSKDNATYIKTVNFNGVIANSLTYLENELSPKKFFRVNRTFIVNISAIKDIVAYSNSRLKLVLQNYNEQEIIVSRERVKDFKNWIN